MHKTGSTSLQSALYGYKDKTTRYARFHFENHSKPIFTLFSKQRYDYHVWRNMGLSTRQVDRLRNKFAKTLEKELNDPKFERLIISGEDISVLDADEKRQFIDYMSSKGLDIKIVMFTRSPLKMAVANISQYVNIGINHVENYDIQYRSRLEPFVKALGRENVHVIDYDQLAEQKQSVVDVFSKSYDVDISNKKILNQSLSIQAMALIYRLNRIPLKVFGNPQRMAMRGKIRDRIVEIFSLENGSTKPLPGRFRYCMGARAQFECDYLRENFGISYQGQFPDPDPAHLIGYFDESLLGFDARLQQLFSTFYTEYDPLRSLEDNFTEAFFNSADKRLRLRWDLDVKKHFARHEAG